MAVVPSASEQGPQAGVFQFTRTGDTGAPLAVHFGMSGSAQLGANYLMWEPVAQFDPGASSAYVTVLPRNDAVQEGDQTIILTLNPGDGYTIGGSSSATVTKHDVFVQGLPGVFDVVSVDQQGTPLISPDLTYVDGFIANGALTVVVGLANNSGLINNFNVWLDTDRNPATGDWRPGHVAGQEYRIRASGGFLGGYELYKLPTAPPTNQLANPDDDQQITTGPTQSNGTLVFVSAPLNLIGNPSAVDLYATTDIGAANNVYQGIGDRAPKYGAFDTASRQVVVPRPGVTQHLVVDDPAGDTQNIGFDITRFEYWSVADQFTFNLTYTKSFDPTRPALFPGPVGVIFADSDRSLVTGGFSIGNDIPSFGADARIFYDIDSLQSSSPLVTVQANNAFKAFNENFNDARNDGRWIALGNTLQLQGSLSILDGQLNSSALQTPLRVLTVGQIQVEAATLSVATGNPVADWVPAPASVLDTTNGQTLQPLVWDPMKTVAAPDPVEYPPPPLSGQDLIEVDAEVIRNTLVVRGVLSSWLNTDLENLFTVLIDSDFDATTAPLGTANSGINGGPTIGIDYMVQLASVEGFSNPVYDGFIVGPSHVSLRADAVVKAAPNANAALPASFTIAFPLGLIQNLGPRLRMYVTTGRIDGAGLLDVAPAQPLEVNLGAPPPPITIVGRHVFYNDSAGDGNNPALNDADLAAIAANKIALLPGQTASSQNISNYSKGLNGLVIDFSSPPLGPMTVDDFDFTVSVPGHPGTWLAAPAPTGVRIISKLAPGAPARIEVAFPNGAIVGRWLRVTVKANTHTGLVAPDTFYFGSLPGDATGDGHVGFDDVLVLAQRYNTSALAADFNADGKIDFSDLVTLAQSYGQSLTPFSAPSTVAGPTSAVFEQETGPRRVRRHLTRVRLP
jgi:hypothetical protein